MSLTIFSDLFSCTGNETGDGGAQGGNAKCMLPTFANTCVP